MQTSRLYCREGDAFDDDDGFTYINQYKVMDVVGKGSFGIVRRGIILREELPGLKSVDSYALKFLSKRKLMAVKFSQHDSVGNLVKLSALDKHKNEVQILKNMSHQNVMVLHEVINDPEDDMLVVVSRLEEHGSLMRYHQDSGMYILNYALLHHCGQETTHHHFFFSTFFPRILRDISNAVNYVHSKGVAHRDIKPENLLVSADFNVVLSDFGSAELFPTAAVNSAADDNFAEKIVAQNNASNRDRNLVMKSDTTECTNSENLHQKSSGRVTNTAGTPGFWAPECIEPGVHQKNNNCSFCLGSTDSLHDDLTFSVWPVDMWAVGIVCYILCYAKHPFLVRNDSEMELFGKILNQSLEVPTELYIHTEAAAAALGSEATKLRIHTKEHIGLGLRMDAAGSSAEGADFEYFSWEGEDAFPEEELLGKDLTSHSDEKNSNYAADVASAGMLSSEEGPPKEGSRTIINNITTSRVDTTTALVDGLLHDLIPSLLTKCPHERLTAQSLEKIISSFIPKLEAVQ